MVPTYTSCLWFPQNVRNILAFKGLRLHEIKLQPKSEFASLRTSYWFVSFGFGIRFGMFTRIYIFSILARHLFTRVNCKENVDRRYLQLSVDGCIRIQHAYCIFTRRSENLDSGVTFCGAPKLWAYLRTLMYSQSTFHYYGWAADTASDTLIKKYIIRAKLALLNN